MHDNLTGDGGLATPQGEPARRHRIRHVLAEELRSYLVSFVYLWVLLGVFTIHQEMALRERAISFAPHGWALINALVLAKVMLVAEKLRIGSRIRPHPLIYPIVIEALILGLLFIAVHVLEHVVSGMIAGETAAASVPLIGGGGFLGLSLAALSMFVALIPFCGFRQVSLAIGQDRMRALLFGAPPAR